MALLPVEEAIARIVAGVRPLGAETVALDDALGRTLAAPLAARRTQPPFAASSMDGYAVRAADLATVSATLRLIGTSAAGAGFGGSVGPGETVRIFTGAPVPAGADAVLIQENTTADGSGSVTANATVRPGQNIRGAGLDFAEGQTLLAAGTVLYGREIALAAAMGYGEVSVVRRPSLAVIATGDELVAPGITPGPDQITAASAPGISAFLRSIGAEVHYLGIVPDIPAELTAAIDRAAALPADALITLGGASVGDHDLVAAALKDRGMALDFWKIAMRPGKPLMFGHLPSAHGDMRVLGLPGNPVSTMVCALLFVKPLVDSFLGRAPSDASEPSVLAVDVKANDARQDYVRATLTQRTGLPEVTPLPVQDSSMLSVLAAADCLLIRAPHAEAAPAGAACRIIRLR